MFQGDLDNLVSSQVCSHRRVLTAPPDHVGFIGFYNTMAISRSSNWVYIGGTPYSACACSVGPRNWGIISMVFFHFQHQLLPENGDRLQRELVGLAGVSNSALGDLCFRTEGSWLLTVRKIYPITNMLAIHCCLIWIAPSNLHGWLHRGQYFCNAWRGHADGGGGRLTDLSSVGHCDGGRTPMSALNCTPGALGRAEDIPRIFFSCMMVELARMR